ncbi:MAG: DUF6291 domain-containing protein [Prevotellaceae bacterium]|nr:DUF6291 domain-containing protein [Prevotellaceae bacterium]MDY6199341.1 DUF6291 domain-containing protein [Prevotella sp.]
MKFVNFQTDRLKNIGLLSDDEAGKVLKMMAQYASSGNVPDDVPPISAILFQAIQEDMEYFDTKYSKRCETNMRIAKERDEARKENERNTNVERTLNERSLNRKEKRENRKDNKDKSLIEKTISFSDDAQMNEAITRWLAYKKERGQTYKPAGLKAFITSLGNLSGGNGEVALKIVEQSMANNYSGVFPLNNNRVETNTPDMGVVLQDSNNKDYSKGGW